MILKYDIELANTRAKLARLEARYESLRNDTAEDGHVRELTMQSLKKYINQFKEEIARSQNGQPARRLRRTLNDVELANTRRKLTDLERLHEAHEKETGGDEELREMSMQSLKKLINQMKEEIIWTEVHQPVRSKAAR
jgi:flagellar biosynthesis chaperone FliJ